MSTTPTPAPAPKSGGALKIILIILLVIVVVFVLFFGLLAYGCYHVAHSIAHSENGKSTINIPGAGSISTNDVSAYTAEELGTDIYPGAKALQGGSKITAPTGSMTTGVFGTQDSAQQVGDFYKNKFGSDAVDYSTSDGGMVSKKISDTESVTVTISANKSANADYKTKFVILHSSTTKTQ